MEKLMLILLIPFSCLLIFIVQSVYSIEAQTKSHREPMRRTERISGKRFGKKTKSTDKINIEKCKLNIKNGEEILCS